LFLTNSCSRIIVTSYKAKNDKHDLLSTALSLKSGLYCNLARWIIDLTY
jgi:hypothetical protein